MGIEKVVRDWAGAAHLMQLLPLAAHGVPAPASLSLVTGPARDGDDGPEELHLVLVDDGRSALRGTEYESALHCIRCGACLYACPVYRQIGGHAYGSTYSGPIGAVLTPALEQGAQGSDELPWLSSLCGACAEACPVKIPLDDQLVSLRADGARRHPRRAEAALFSAWARLWSRPGGYRATAATAGKALGPLWGTAGARGHRRRAGTPARLSRSPAGPDGRDVRAPRSRALPRPLEEAAWLTRWRLSGPARRLRRRVCTSPTRWRRRAQRARELIGGATVAAWEDDVARRDRQRERGRAEDAEVSLIAADAGVVETGQIAFVHRAGRTAARRPAARAPGRAARRCGGRVRRWPRRSSGCSPTACPGNVVLVAGPSRTADIEQRSIRGVHAPRELDVIVYRAQCPPTSSSPEPADSSAPR